MKIKITLYCGKDSRSYVVEEPEGSFSGQFWFDDVKELLSFYYYKTISLTLSNSEQLPNSRKVVYLAEVE